MPDKPIGTENEMCDDIMADLENEVLAWPRQVVGYLNFFTHLLMKTSAYAFMQCQKLICY